MVPVPESSSTDNDARPADTESECVLPRTFSRQRPLKILVDTNVWFDYFLARSDCHKAAAQFLACGMEREDVALFIASLSLKDLACQLSNQMKLDARRAGREVDASVASAAREVSWACVRNVLEKALVAPVGHTEVLNAFAYRRIHNDLEDDLILGALDAIEGDYLMTHDAALARHTGDLCITAEEGLQLLQQLDKQNAS